MIKKILLNLYIWPMFGLTTVTGLLLIPLILAGNAISFRVPVSQLFRKGVRVYGWVLVRLIPFFAPAVLENRGAREPVTGIYVTNHNSAADPYCFGILPGEYAFLTSWPFGIPVYNWVMKQAEYLNTAWGWPTLLEHATRLLKNGCSLIIWPEGHRSRNGRLGNFANGAFRLACETGFPVVPVCITGTFRLMPPGSRLLTPSRIRLTVLPAHYPPKGPNQRQDVRKLKEAVRDAIKNELRRQGYER